MLRLGSKPVIRQGEWGARVLSFGSVVVVFGSISCVIKLFDSYFVGKIYSSILLFCLFFVLFTPNIPFYFDKWQLTSPIGTVLILFGFFNFMFFSLLLPSILMSSPIYSIITNLVFMFATVTSLCVSVKYIYQSFETKTTATLDHIVEQRRKEKEERLLQIEKESPSKFKGHKEVDKNKKGRVIFEKEAILGTLTKASDYEKRFLTPKSLLILKIMLWYLCCNIAFLLPFLLQDSPTINFAIGITYSLLCLFGILYFHLDEKLSLLH
eukprot:TRINITY_DN10709_c0_g1_i1.p1 TRINITY_DN10709_c0_g1~~TRINITY_DN10709_c0_g1_i1.p1  ORF type:complete len:313 (+),score=83.58 TRINITY_DN10709_c0_g1_i1:141-941(+)